MSNNGANQKGFLQKNWIWLTGCGCLVILVLIAGLVGGFFLLRDSGGAPSAPAANSGADDDDSGMDTDTGSSGSDGGSSRNDIIVYSVFEEEDFPQAVYSVQPTGENNIKLASYPDGMFFFTIDSDHILAAGQADYGEMLEMLLVDIHDGSNLSLHLEGALGGGVIFKIISESGERFAQVEYDYDTDTYSIVVYEVNGELVARIENYLPFEFASETEILAAYFEPDDDFFSFGIIDLETENFTEFYSEDDIELTMFPKLSPDASYVFFGTGEGLARVDTESGEYTIIYEFSGEYEYSDYFSLFFLEGTDQALFLENFDLYLFDVEEGVGELVDRDVFGYATGLDISMFGFGSGDYFTSGSGIVGAPFIVSPNGRQLAYLVRDGDDYVFELKVYTFSDGSITTISSGGSWYEYDFTADSRSLIVIEHNDSYQSAGDLFMIDIDGANRTMLDTDVTSFTLSGNGRSVYYAAIIDEDEAISGIFSINLNNGERTEILTEIDGFAWVAEIPD